MKSKSKKKKKEIGNIFNLEFLIFLKSEEIFSKVLGKREMIFGFNLERVCLITGLLFVCYFNDANGLPRSYRTNEICGQYNGYRLYLEQGQSGILEAHNVSISNVIKIK